MKVQTDDGERPIEEIEVGDEVIAKEEDNSDGDWITRKSRLYTVTNVMILLSCMLGAGHRDDREPSVLG